MACEYCSNDFTVNVWINKHKYKLCPYCGRQLQFDYYDKCLCNLKEFAFNGLVLKPEELLNCLRNVLGHEPCELLNNSKLFSLTDIQTDLRYLFDRIKIMEAKGWKE